MNDAVSVSTLTCYDIVWMSNLDGPGSRVVVFLQGCHLRCPWCHSPHSWAKSASLLFFEAHCTLCGNCEQVCPNKVHQIINGKHNVNYARCQKCGACIKSCPQSRRSPWNSGALGLPDHRKTPSELFQHLQPQLELLKSIGGLTISGGEPLLQAFAVRKLLELCRANDFHTAVETSASLALAAVKSLTDVVNCWLIGLRPTLPGVCPPAQVADLEKVKKNLQYLSQECKDKIIIRFPIIPGYTDQPQAITTIIAIMNSNRLSKAELLPFNPVSSSYYQAMGMSYPLTGVIPPSESQLQAIQEQFSHHGITSHIVI